MNKLIPRVAIEPSSFDPVGYYDIAMARRTGAMIVCVDRGYGWELARFSLPHQFYQRTADELVEKYPDIKVIAAFPVDDFELLAVDEQDAWASAFVSKSEAGERLDGLEAANAELLKALKAQDAADEFHDRCRQCDEYGPTCDACDGEYEAGQELSRAAIKKAEAMNRKYAPHAVNCSCAWCCVNRDNAEQQAESAQ